jgi:hypothetical protein
MDLQHRQWQGGSLLSSAKPSLVSTPQPAGHEAVALVAGLLDLEPGGAF